MSILITASSGDCVCWWISILQAFAEVKRADAIVNLDI
jgi:hypothetical protein